MLPVAPMARTLDVALGAEAAVTPPTDIEVFAVDAKGTAAWSFGFETGADQYPVAANEEKHIPVQVRANNGNGDGTTLFVTGTGTLSLIFYGAPKRSP